MDKAENFQKKDGGVVLNIDYRMRGVGSHSCGPEIDGKYRITEEEISFAFDLLIL